MDDVANIFLPNDEGEESDDTATLVERLKATAPNAAPTVVVTEPAHLSPPVAVKKRAKKAIMKKVVVAITRRKRLKVSSI